MNICNQYSPFVPQPIILINYSKSVSPPADDRWTMNGKHPRLNDMRTKATHKQKISKVEIRTLLISKILIGCSPVIY